MNYIIVCGYACWDGKEWRNDSKFAQVYANKHAADKAIRKVSDIGVNRVDWVPELRMMPELQFKVSFDGDCTNIEKCKDWEKGMSWSDCRLQIMEYFRLRAQTAAAMCSQWKTTTKPEWEKNDR